MSIESTQESPTSKGESVSYPGPASITQDGDTATAVSEKSPAAHATHARSKSSGDWFAWLLFNVVCPLILLALAGGVVYVLGSVESPARPPIDDTPVGRLFALPAVDVVPVQSLASTGQKLELTTDGTVVPFREIVLATEVAGQIVEKSPLCEAGKYVNQGDVLMVINPTDYRLEVKRLQRLQQQEYEALGEVDQEMANTDRSMELARADIELQRRELKRQETLPSQFASKGEIDQARRALLQAEQALLTLQNQLELSKKRRIRLQSAEQLAKMQLEAAQNNLDRTQIVAPMDGVIVSEQAELNTFVARGSPLVTMEDTSKVEVAASLRTDQLYWVLNQKLNELDSLTHADGNPVRGYNLPATPVKVQYLLSGRDDLAYQWQGELIGYDGIGLDEQTRTVPVRILVDDPQSFTVLRNGKAVNPETESATEVLRVAGPTTLVRGMFVNLRLELDPSVELVVLPGESLKPGNRIWQFIPDASVLDVSLNVDTESLTEDSKKDSLGKSTAQSTEPDDDDAVDDEQAAAGLASEPTPEELAALEEESKSALAEEGFVPSAWVAGNLRIVQGIRPVDRYVGPLGSPDSESPSWICEVPKSSSGSLGDGSYVIVSPLGSLSSDTVPVRASAEVMQPVAGQSNTASTPVALRGDR
ncbi:HlyD family secretion protein [Neorhodopirellula lusitana]|uniref:HlyD family secretion protein n=1 Tax=Neorhodopirellula lusitana TaxID=445327 RepID=UPI00384F7298